MIDGVVEKVGADSSDNRGQGNTLEESGDTNVKADSRLYYKTLVTLASQRLAANGISYKLAPGMQAAAEIKLGTRTVLEYLFSPVTKAFHEAGRER
jgi:HlyD family secretion protein